MKKKFASEYEKEIEVMKNIKSKYIVEYKDDFYDKTNDGYYIVMELCDGDLRKILDENKPKGLPLNMINKIFIQLNEALKTIIENGYSHRDFLYQIQIKIYIIIVNIMFLLCINQIYLK